MDEIKERDPEATEPEPIEVEEEEPSAATLITQFFVIPLLVIAVAVGVFLMFGMLTQESRSASDYLDEVRSGSRARRYQAAFELSKMLDYDPEAAREPGFAAELGRVFVESRDQEPEMRRYLALALGRVGLPATVEALLTGLDDPDPQTRIYTVWALGAVGDSRAVAPIAVLLQDADPGVRKIAAHALGSLGDPGAIPGLTTALDDSEVDVQWNAALSLGQLGDPAGLPILHRMLDRDYLGRLEGVTPEQTEQAMVNAIRVLAMLEDGTARDRLQELSDHDSSLDVRSVARDALASLPSPG